MKFIEAQSKNTRIDDETIKTEFSPTGIKTRLDMFQVINDYADTLAKVAGSTDESQFMANVDELKKNINDLGSKVSSDSDLQSYTTPIAALVSWAGAELINYDRVRLLRSAINQASPQVDKIMELLQRDFRRAYEEKRTALLAEYNAYRLAYNKQLATGRMPQQEKERQIARLEQSYDAYELLASQTPGDAIEGMRTAHKALVKFAEDFNNVNNFQQFVSAVDLFSRKAKQALKVAKQLYGE